MKNSFHFLISSKIQFTGYQLILTRNISDSLYKRNTVDKLKEPRSSSAHSKGWHVHQEIYMIKEMHKCPKAKYEPPKVL